MNQNHIWPLCKAPLFALNWVTWFKKSVERKWSKGGETRGDPYDESPIEKIYRIPTSEKKNLRNNLEYLEKDFEIFGERLGKIPIKGGKRKNSKKTEKIKEWMKMHLTRDDLSSIWNLKIIYRLILGRRIWPDFFTLNGWRHQLWFYTCGFLDWVPWFTL